MSGGEHLVLSTHGTPVSAEDTEAGRGRSCLHRQTGPSLVTVVLLPESRDGEISPGAPVPLATGARGAAGGDLGLPLLHHPTVPVGEGRNEPFHSAADRQLCVTGNDARAKSY